MSTAALRTQSTVFSALMALSSCLAVGRCLAQSISSMEDRGIAPRMLQPARDASEYYPATSLRVGETGRVVLRFTVNVDGKAVEPFTVNEEQTLAPSKRLVIAAENYLKDARFDIRAHDKKVLEAIRAYAVSSPGTRVAPRLHHRSVPRPIACA
ncbi:MAG TPA: hypothetical protein VKB72_11325 [Steroidobacteraceae bacterium]|nr:hypothetical protein [Steroidobacteraceae bacterium]